MQQPGPATELLEADETSSAPLLLCKFVQQLMKHLQMHGGRSDDLRPISDKTTFIGVPLGPP